MPRGRKDSPELRQRFLKAYEKNGCRLYRTCKELGIYNEVIEDWIRLYPDFKLSKKEIDRLNSEKYTENIDNMADKNILANIFALKHHQDDEVRARFSDDTAQQIDLTIKPLWFNDKDKDALPPPKEAIDTTKVEEE